MRFVGSGLRELMYFCLVHTPHFFNQTTKCVTKEICLYVILSKLSSFCLNYRHSGLLYSFTGIVTCSSVKSAFVACALTLKPNVRFFSLGKL